MTEADQTSTSDETLQTARTWNFDAYLAATLAPATARESLIAIAACVGELDRIRLTVSEPALAQIRIQWWRDELQRIARDGASDHPVGIALVDAVAQHALPTGLLIGIADAVFDQVGDTDFPDEQAFTVWLRKRYAAPFELAFRCLGAPEQGPTRDVIKAAGQAYGLARLLHETAAQDNVLERYRVHKSPAELKEDVAAQRGRISAATGTGARASRSVFLPVVLTGVYLATAQKPGAPQPTPFQKVRHMAWAHFVKGL